MTARPAGNITFSRVGGISLDIFENNNPSGWEGIHFSLWNFENAKRDFAVALQICKAKVGGSIGQTLNFFLKKEEK